MASPGTPANGSTISPETSAKLDEIEREGAGLDFDLLSPAERARAAWPHPGEADMRRASERYWEQDYEARGIHKRRAALLARRGLGWAALAYLIRKEVPLLGWMASNLAAAAFQHSLEARYPTTLGRHYSARAQGLILLASIAVIGVLGNLWMSRLIGGG